MRTSSLFLFFLAVVIGLGIFLWSRREIMTVPTASGANLSVLIDNSSSQKVDCKQIGQLVDAGLSNLEIGKGSQLSVYTLGSQATSYEPVPVVSIGLQKGFGSRKKAVRKVQQACASIGTVDGSSIYRAVQVVLNQMHNAGNHGGKLLVQTDLEENVDSRLFKQHGKNALLNNAGIATDFCGVAATAEGGGPRGAHADAMVKTWQGAFTSPKQVSFRPFCEGQGTQQAAR